MAPAALGLGEGGGRGASGAQQPPPWHALRSGRCSLAVTVLICGCECLICGVRSPPSGYDCLISVRDCLKDSGRDCLMCVVFARREGGRGA